MGVSKAPPPVVRVSATLSSSPAANKDMYSTLPLSLCFSMGGRREVAAVLMGRGPRGALRRGGLGEDESCSTDIRQCYGLSFSRRLILPV